MIRGVYTSAMGMLQGVRRMEVLSQNLTNMETPGYRADDSMLLAAPGHAVTRLAMSGSGPVGVMGLGTLLTSTHTSVLQGDLEGTGRSLDVALTGPGFLVVNRGGVPAYTRHGVLIRDDGGMLVTAGGHPVLSTTGAAIQLPDGHVTITPEGEINVDGSHVATLSIVEFGNPQGLLKAGDVFFLPTGASGAAGPAVDTSLYQGFRERSNVDLVDQAIKMTLVSRAYEASQRALKAQDETMALAAREVGRV